MTFVFRVKLKQGFAGEELLNIFHYRNSLDNITHVELKDMFNDTLVELIRVVTSDTLRYISTSIERLDNFTPPQEFPFPSGVEGTVGSDGMTPFDAFSSFYPVATRSTRSGKKRFGGITEGMQARGVLNTLWTTGWETLSLALSQTLTNTAGDLAVPIVLRQLGLGPGSILQLNPIITGIFRGIGSQVSRKIGRGASDPASALLVPDPAFDFGSYIPNVELQAVKDNFTDNFLIDSTETDFEEVTVTV